MKPKLHAEKTDIHRKGKDNSVTISSKKGQKRKPSWFNKGDNFTYVYSISETNTRTQHVILVSSFLKDMGKLKRYTKAT